MAPVLPLLGPLVIASAAFAIDSEADAAPSQRAPLFGGVADAVLLVVYGAAAVLLLIGWRGWRPGPLDGAAWRPKVATGLVMAVALILSGTVGALVGDAVGRAALGSALAQVIAAATIVWQRRQWMARTECHPASAAWSVLGGVVGLAICWPLVQIAGALGSAAYALLVGGETPLIGHESLRRLQEQGISVELVFCVIVAAPFVEEVLYRAVIQQVLRSSGMARIPVVVITAALFAVMHLGENAVTGASAWAALPALFVLGLLFGVLYERTGRLAAPVVAHALFNFVNVLAAIAGGVSS